MPRAKNPSRPKRPSRMTRIRASMTQFPDIEPPSPWLLAFEQRQGSAKRGEGGGGSFHSHDHRVRDLSSRTVEHLQLEVPAGPLGDRSGIELDFVVD